MNASTPSHHRVSGRTAVSVAVLVGLATLLTAPILGPKTLPVAKQRTGDPDLAGQLADLARPGHHRLAAFTITDDSVTFAGLGADEHSEVEIGSVTKTFTAEILRNQIRAGRVGADTTVGEIIDVHDAPVGDVTLRELATHTSGLPRLAGNSLVRAVIAGFLDTNPYADITREDVIDAARSADCPAAARRSTPISASRSSASCWPSRPAPPTRHWSPSRSWSRWG